MPIKPKKNGVRSTHFLSKRWERLGRAIGLSVLAVGILLLLLGNLLATAASQANATSYATPTPASQHSGVHAPVGSVGPLVEESEWGMWHKGDVAQSFPTRQHPYSIGQTISVPNYVSIRVDSVDRNWTPQPWQASPFPVGFQDDAHGKEVILVRFTITNLSHTTMNYSDHYFSLGRANGHEQRVAALAELTGDQYGSFGRPTPWLLPGVTVHTFVPLLVNPGEQPRQFVLSWQTIDPTHVTTVTATNGKEIVTPAYVKVARIPIALSAPFSQGSQTPPVSSVTFVPDTTFKVADADVYSTTGN